MLLKSSALVSSLELSTSLWSWGKLELSRNLVRRWSCKTNSCKIAHSHTQILAHTLSYIHVHVHTLTELKLSWQVKRRTVGASSIARRGWDTNGWLNSCFPLSGNDGGSSIMISKVSLELNCMLTYMYVFVIVHYSNNNNINISLTSLRYEKWMMYSGNTRSPSDTNHCLAWDSDEDKGASLLR